MQLASLFRRIRHVFALMLIVNGRVLGRSVQDLLRHFSVRQVGFFSQQHSMDSNDFWWSEEQFSV